MADRRLVVGRLEGRAAVGESREIQCLRDGSLTLYFARENVLAVDVLQRATISGVPVATVEAFLIGREHPICFDCDTVDQVNRHLHALLGPWREIWTPT